MSSLLIIAAVVGAIVLIALAVLRAKAGGESTDGGSGSDYEPQTLFSPAERSFLGVLEGSLPDGVGLLAKVRLADVFRTRKGLTQAKRSSANNRLRQKHVDFLLVSITDVRPIAGVELDDSSHERTDRKARDSFVDDVFRSSKLPLLHVTAKATYNPAELRQSIVELLKVKP